MSSAIWSEVWSSIPWSDVWVVVATPTLLVLLTFGVWRLWWRLPDHYVRNLSMKIRDPKARADVEDNMRKTMGQLLGGIAVLVGAGLAYLQFVGQQRAAHDLLISNQVSRGFEQLGSNKLVVRLGGVYALEGAMNGSKEYQIPVLEALSAFIRESTRCENEGMETKTEKGLPPCPKQPTTDVQATLTVIGRRLGKRSPGSGAPNLNRVSISGANLPDTNLIGVSLNSANLTSADLTSAQLVGTFLMETKLNFARLERAHLEYAVLYRANLTKANLTKANLTKANLTKANLTDADLTDANFTDADLTDADLTRANLTNANLFSANLTRANLTNANLDGATGILPSQLSEACGAGAKLPSAQLKLAACRSP